jgi:ABC-type lipoprotein export system ATPase subunit
MQPAIMIRTTRLSYSYKGRRTIIYPDWTLMQGQQSIITGKPGSGKTTLLYLISGLLGIQMGEIQVCDQKLNDLKGSKLDRFRGRYIGFINSTPGFIPFFTIQDNLFLAQQFGTGSENIERAYILLHEFGFAGKAANYPSELGLFDLKVVEILRAIINKPKIILADEPTLGLGEKESNALLQILTSQAANYESTLIIATENQMIRELFKNQLRLENA